MNHSPNDPKLSSWAPVAAGHDFPIQNLPFGIISRSGSDKKVAASIIGDQAIDLARLQAMGAFEGLGLPEAIFLQSVLNPFISLGRSITRAVRQRLSDILRIDTTDNRFATQSGEWLLPPGEFQNHLPVAIGDYTDFYSSLEHATNVGSMFRDPSNPLLPNWKHIPVGYHGRASSIRVSGHAFPRPHGQLKPNDGPPEFGPSRMIDFELEMGFIIGRSTDLGDSIPVEQAEEYIFGMVLFNDWSARDIQRWEYVPLGPFLGKNFASTMSAWIVTMDALEPFRTTGPEQDPPVLPYLQTRGAHTFDINLEVLIQPSGGQPAPVCHSNFKYLYWSMAQQLAHHSVNGCNMRVGDLCASGTISGPTETSYGSMLELSWGGKKEVDLGGGITRKSIQDGDTVYLKGYCEKDGLRIGFGDCTATLLPART
ncbi:MAG: fumarylacetoacetase [Lewinellaceae bacterium]|nr:fumarylacetoacetase [Saprospiraceae bacterium]MCB9314147.1 fumarylacetoacetase [Lewinellaceae bacterium]HRW75691.1 fumarylacetoacetase [Saprospiraceae bacterium]